MSTQKTYEKVVEFENIGENMVKQLITKQFLQNLKQQLGQKVKPSKSILQALRHSNTLNIGYKKTIEQLNIKQITLSEQNLALKAKVEKLQQDLRNKILQNNKIKSLESQQIIPAIICEHTQYQQLIETLKEKIQCLEECKNIKQIKITELLAKQVQYVGQINLLQYKNNQLKIRITQMNEGQETIKTKKKTSQMNSSDRNRKGSDNSQNFKIYINQQDSIKSDHSIAELKEIQYLIVPKDNRSMLVSCTEVVDIEQSYNIDILAQKNRKEEREEFNQIDYMIGQQMPFIKTQSNINSQRQGFKNTNINSSIVAINMSFPQA